MALIGYQLTYNSVPLEIVHPEDIGRDHIYSEDGTTYLYTRWIFDGVFIYNPQATSFNADGDLTPGLRPIQTDVNIREKLRAQRKQLVFAVGGQELVRCPVDGLSTDAKNGPVVERCNIIRTIGVKTFYVDLKITCHINECLKSLNDANGDNQGITPVSPLLSHRWRRTETYDEDYYSAVVTEGTCIFRSDVLLAMRPDSGLGWSAFPDQFRRELFHPIPAMFKRGPVEVLPHEDGLTYSYRITDTQKAFRGPNNQNCTRIQAYQTAWFDSPSSGEIASGFPNIIGMIRRTVPQYRQHCMVRAWGNSNSTRASLTNLCVAVFLGALGRIGRNLGNEFFVSHDLTGKFVQLEVTYRYGLEQMLGLVAAISFDESGLLPIPGSAINGGYNNTIKQFANVQKNFESVPFRQPATETFWQHVGGVIIGPEDIQDLSPISPPPNDSGSRGTWLGNILAQALSGQCEKPAKPPILPNPTDFSSKDKYLNPVRVTTRNLY